MKFEEVKTSSFSKYFLSMKDGSEIVGIFQGEPHIHYVHWDKTQNRSAICSQDENCKFCQKGDKKAFKFRLNMVVKNEETKKLEAKILEGPKRLYGLLSELHKDFPLEETFVKVKRTGKTMNDTVYSALPQPKIALNEDLKNRIAEVPLLPLPPTDPFWTPKLEDSGTGFAHEEDEETIPF